MIKQVLINYIDKCIEKYINFMEIDCMPKFEIVPVVISSDSANIRGYGALATHFYNPDTCQHRLEVWDDLYKTQLHSEYVLFHEFTHILDIDKYSNGDKIKNASIKGYTEYHAAQIDLFNLLGADKIRSTISFSMKDKFETISGKKTVLEYMIDTHKAVATLISRADFPKDVDVLVVTMGLIFNYLGRLSICKMYANDYLLYKDILNDTEAEKKFLGAEVYNALNSFCDGILEQSKIELLNEFYLKMMASMISKYKLT